MVNIAVFASGRGSNAQAIIEYLKDNEEIKVALIASNKPQAGVLLLAKEYDIPTLVFDRQTFKEGSSILGTLLKHKIQAIILAGFLWKIPDYLLEAFPEKIINIHPALLPKYGGKGMYGHHVHQAVFDNKEIESGITIHLVNAQYDKGKVLFQASIEIDSEDQPDDIAKKVLELEHYYYPRIVEAFIDSL
jgi:phosphoribosylglycinamide formyltransferase-1